MANEPLTAKEYLEAINRPAPERPQWYSDDGSWRARVGDSGDLFLQHTAVRQYEFRLSTTEATSLGQWLLQTWPPPSPAKGPEPDKDRQRWAESQELKAES